jgi:hypothetical protein
MKIAILGWGSLIWNTGNLEIDKTVGKNGWFDDGPSLPIEFARISKNDRLTLVIVPGVENVQTLYSISSFTELDYAILNLSKREGCNKDKIGYYLSKNDEVFPTKFKCTSEIRNWVNKNEDIEAVIWTNLSKKFKDKIGLDWNEKNVLHYLNSLPFGTKVLAEQYVRRTPIGINTKMRQVIEDELKWYKIL